MSTAPTSTTTLEQAARKVPRSTIEAAANVLRASDNPARAAFVARALNALARLVPAVGDRALGDAAGASTDFDALLRVLQQPAVLATIRPDDPLAAERLRGLRASHELLAGEGGTLSVAQVAHLLGLTRQAVDKRRRAGRLIGLSLGRRGYAYPAWQFSENGLLPGLESVQADLRDYDPWMQTVFWLGNNDRLDGETPLARLRRGDLEAVRCAAQAYGVHGAA